MAAKNETPAPVADSAASAEIGQQASDFKLSLQEFCTRLSATDRRVELIGGFEHTERVAGRLQDTHDNFTARYDEFANQPA